MRRITPGIAQRSRCRSPCGHRPDRCRRRAPLREPRFPALAPANGLSAHNANCTIGVHLDPATHMLHGRTDCLVGGTADRVRECRVTGASQAGAWNLRP